MKVHESWVTFASNDNEALKALILSRSLRHVITRRMLTVFVSQGVSEEIIELLELGFDRCVLLTKKYQELRFRQLDFGAVVKIRALRLLQLRKIVFVDPNCFVVKNVDELFRHGRFISYSGSGKVSRARLFGCIPSEKKFQKLSEMSTTELKGMEKVCGLEPTDETFNGKYLGTIDFHNPTMQWNVDGLSIVDFAGEHPIDVFMAITNGHSIEKTCPEGSLQRVVFDACLEHLPFAELNEIKNMLQPNLQAKLEKLTLRTPKNMELEKLDELKNSIAIVGMGMRLPQADNFEEFWDLLFNGKDGITHPTEGRWAPDRCWNRTDNTKGTQAGFLKCPIDEIDGKFFGLSPLELQYMDPQQRLTLQVLWEALEHAGINPNSLKQTNTGVFGGWWRHDYKEMLQECGLNENEFFRTYMGNSLGTLTGRISHVLDITGPSISTESGCSTSIVAVDMGCKSLLNEDSDLALAFGVNLLLHPFSDQTLSGVIAPDGHCKTFDANADGFGRAEGCVALVLKRFADAVRDGDKIHALIRGSAVVQEGPSRSMGTPTKKCEALSMTLALDDAGVEPKDVSFVETHGTGTPVGDPLEVAAVAEAYSKDRVDPLIIGSVKTNIGHTESCSGIAGIIKTVLSLQHEIIPPHRNFETLNPDIHLEQIPAIIPLEPTKWQRNNQSKPRIAGVSSFGITGTDAHVIIQETPSYLPPRSLLQITSKFTSEIMKLSAKSPESLDHQLNCIKKFLRQTNDDLKDICFTSNVGRGDFQYRAAIVGKTKAEMIDKLQKKTVGIKQIASEPQKLGFLFTGQGSQYPGMAKQVYENNPVFRFHFDNCAQILSKDYSISIKEAMWGKDQEFLSRTLYSQTSIFCVEYALFKLWESWGIKPDFVLGHSLGEFCAAVAAGILNVQDALKLVAERSRLIDGLPRGKMIALKKSKDEVKELVALAIKEYDGLWLDYAAINSPEQIVLAGTDANISRFAEFCENNAVKAHVLQSTHAFHSRMMDPMLNEYREIAQKVSFNGNTKCTYVSGMDGIILDGHVIDAEYWVRHTKEPVRFTDASKAILESGVTKFLEMGPQPVLSALMLYNTDAVESITEPVVCLPSLRKNEEEFVTLQSSIEKLYINGFDINWEGLHAFTHREKVPFPYYPFQNKSHWFDITSGRQRAIHPLVGTQNSNPSPMKLFHQSLDVNHCKFLKDHVIGNTIIYPGAGFLEMCLVAGHAAYQCLENEYAHPVAPISLEDFIIEAPLAMSENENTQIQTVVTTEDSGETRMTVYSKLILDKETHKWIRHASALFSPYAVQWEGEEGFKNDTLESIKSRCPDAITTDGTYDKFTSFGLKFGPMFRTLQAAWKGHNEVYFKVAVTACPDSFICHPVMVDAMFQAIIIGGSGSEETKETLHVPVSVTKFIFISQIKTETCFIHCKKAVPPGGGEGEVVAILYDENGQKLAIMFGAMLLETSSVSILSAIEAQRTALPNMYEEIWKKELGTWDRRLQDMPNIAEMFPEQIVQQITKAEEPDADSKLIYNNINELCLKYVLKAWYDLGWEPFVGECFNLKKFLNTINSSDDFKAVTRHWLMELVIEGYLRVEAHESDRDKVEFRVVKDPPPPTEISSRIEELLENSKFKNLSEVLLLSEVGKNYKDILTKKVSGLSVLFPENPEKGSAENYYFDSTLCSQNRTIGLPQWEKLVDEFILKRKDKELIRILEIGAGTGSNTKAVLKMLDEKCPGAFEYTYTDISAAFFIKGESVFENSGIKHVFKTLNIEEDPTTQGFVPHSYDVVSAAFVIHATENVSTAFAHIRNLLRPGGVVTLMEFTNPSREINLIFGVAEGFWRFKDYENRPHNCSLPINKWESVISQRNFEYVVKIPTYFDHCALIWAQAADHTYILDHLTPKVKTWVVFTEEGSKHGEIITNRLSEVGRDVKIIHPSSDYRNPSKNVFEIRRDVPEDMLKTFESFKSTNSQLEGIVYLWGLNNNGDDFQPIVQPYLTLSKLAIKMDSTKLFVITQGVLGIDNDGSSLPTSSPLCGMNKALQNENATISCKCIDIDTIGDINEVLEDAMSEFFMDDAECYVVYRNKSRQVCRFVTIRLPSDKLIMPNSERTKLILPPSKAIRDLRFGAAEKKAILGDYEVEIKIKAMALNFRDVFVVLKPTPEFDEFNTVGLDFAGEVISIGSKVTLYKLGDAVCSFNVDGDSVPSHIVKLEDHLIPVENNLTFAQAAAMPAVAATAFMCLITVAKIQEGENVLIHTGSGGVGLLAIQVAQSRKCNIITTAGSPRKRAYLRNMGIKHVFNSRNPNYEQGIKEALGGNNIDVVLNSITGPGFKEATLSVCKQGARFVEMSKLNVWSVEEVKELRPDVFYEIVDLTKTTAQGMKDLLDLIRINIKSGVFKPIPYVKFDTSDIREALNYMQKAKHIGKLVCVLPDGGKTNKGVGTNQETLMFNDRSTYLVTGGLGGIGFEVAKWITESGGKHVVLAGRHDPNEKLTADIKNMNSRGAHVVAVQCDVGYFDQCVKLVDWIKSPESEFPPLRGIMFAAGVLSDASFENQTWEKYEETFHPKVRGAWNMHKLTLDCYLEHFVMFSSAVALFGSMGQSNHAAANTFLDTLAHYRNSIGLPATTVNWGQWGQVGVAANLDVIGLKPITTLQGISALQEIMKSQRLQTAVMEANFSVIRKGFPVAKNYVKDLKEGSSERIEGVQVNAEEFWKEYDATETKEQKIDVVISYLRVIVRRILKLDDSDTIDDNGELQDMGMDSLMMIELKNILQCVIGSRAKITVNSVKDCTTITKLATRVVELVSGIEDAAAPTREEFMQLVRDDAPLSATIEPSEAFYCKPSKISCVLVTGVTGNLGPYCLREISKQTNVTKIYCLMKPTPKTSPLERLQQALTEKGLITEVRMEIVECIAGNFIEEKFGLNESIYKKLCEEVEAVFHLGVRSVWQECYRKGQHSDQDIRTVNVFGTTNILEFASTGKTKHLYHASTTLATTRLGEDGRLLESWPNVEDFDTLPNDAYAVSKFISELRIEQAVERGLPCKIFRFPLIGGDTKTGGNITAFNNQILLRMISYMYLGMMPAHKIPFMIVPVDICAELSVQIFFNDKTQFDIYNVSNPYVNDEQDFEDIAQELGHPIEIVEVDDFIDKLENTHDSELLVFAKKGLENSEFRDRLEEAFPAPALKWVSGDKEVFISQKMVDALPQRYPQCMESSLDILKRDLLHCKTSGVFQKFGLK